MKNLVNVILLLIFSVGIFSFSNSDKTTEKKVKWYSWEEAIKANEKNPRPILVDIYTDWCGWCKKMDKSTFEDDKVAAYLNKNYYPVKLNAEQKEDIIWKEVTFKFVPNGRRGYHTLAASLTEGRLSYPTFVYLNEKFERIMISPGYKDANGIMPELVFAAEDHYNKTTWEEFKKNYPLKKEEDLPKEKEKKIEKPGESKKIEGKDNR